MGHCTLLKGIHTHTAKHVVVLLPHLPVTFTKMSNPKREFAHKDESAAQKQKEKMDKMKFKWNSGIKEHIADLGHGDCARFEKPLTCGMGNLEKGNLRK